MVYTSFVSWPYLSRISADIAHSRGPIVGPRGVSFAAFSASGELNALSRAALVLPLSSGVARLIGTAAVAATVLQAIPIAKRRSRRISSAL